MILERQIMNMYRGMAFTRCDGDGTAYYFSADDFAGLHKESYPFLSSRGYTLQGYLYYYDNPIRDRLIVFEHGLGGGHRSYMKEIGRLCGHGFLVLAYDHTGCMESEGDHPNGMAQSLCDLNDCINTLKKDERFATADISVMGHSWGAFSSMNIPALHPDISHIVAISGFVSVELLVHSFFGGIMKGYRKPIMQLEQSVNPDFVGYNAVESLSKTNAKVLLLYSDNDRICRKKAQYDTLKAGLGDRENIQLVLVSGKGHNPNYTEDAVRYLGEYVSKRAKMIKKKQLQTEEQKKNFLASWDWDRMTAQDDAVWKVIFYCLDA